MIIEGEDNEFSTNFLDCSSSSFRDRCIFPLVDIASSVLSEFPLCGPVLLGPFDCPWWTLDQQTRVKTVCPFEKLIRNNKWHKQ